MDSEDNAELSFNRDHYLAPSHSEHRPTGGRCSSSHTAPCPPLFQVARAVMGIKNEWEDPNGTRHGQGHCSSPKSRIKGDKHKNSSYRMGSSNECHFAKTKQKTKTLDIYYKNFIFNKWWYIWCLTMGYSTSNRTKDLSSLFSQCFFKFLKEFLHLKFIS